MYVVHNSVADSAIFFEADRNALQGELDFTYLIDLIAYERL